MFATRIVTEASLTVSDRDGAESSIVSGHKSIIFTGCVITSIPNQESFLPITPRVIAALLPADSPKGNRSGQPRVPLLASPSSIICQGKARG
jgi:hypothetical protein